MGTTASKLEYDHLLKVNNESKTQYLSEEQAQTFHHIVPQLLFMSDRSCKYIQAAVALLTICVNKT